MTSDTTEPGTIKGDPIQTGATGISTITVGKIKGKDNLIAATKALLLVQHQHPTETEDGEKITRYDLGIREGRVQTYLDVLREFPGAPDYSALDDGTLRAMLLGQALTESIGA